MAQRQPHVALRALQLAALAACAAAATKDGNTIVFAAFGT